MHLLYKQGMKYAARQSCLVRFDQLTCGKCHQLPVTKARACLCQPRFLTGHHTRRHARPGNSNGVRCSVGYCWGRRDTLASHRSIPDVSKTTRGTEQKWLDINKVPNINSPLLLASYGASSMLRLGLSVALNNAANLHLPSCLQTTTVEVRGT